MKMMVKLAVLFAALLLLSGTGMAFAEGSCQCYEVTCTNLDNGSTINHNVEFCLNPWNEPPDGSFDGLCGYQGSMSLFFDSMKLQAITVDSSVDASLKFHGDWYHVVTGIVNCYGSRWSIRGQATDCKKKT